MHGRCTVPPTQGHRCITHTSWSSCCTSVMSGCDPAVCPINAAQAYKACSTAYMHVYPGPCRLAACGSMRPGSHVHLPYMILTRSMHTDAGVEPSQGAQKAVDVNTPAARTLDCRHLQSSKRAHRLLCHTPSTFAAAVRPLCAAADRRAFC